MYRVDKNGKDVKVGGRCSAGTTDCTKGPGPKPTRKPTPKPTPKPTRPPKSCTNAGNYQCLNSKGFCLNNHYIKCGANTRCTNKGTKPNSPCVHAAEPAFMLTEEEGPGKCKCRGVTPCRH